MYWGGGVGGFGDLLKKVSKQAAWQCRSKHFLNLLTFLRFKT